MAAAMLPEPMMLMVIMTWFLVVSGSGVVPASSPWLRIG
jgi:hypothetical protein